MKGESLSPNGYISYLGPSRIDKKPILAISTGFTKPSANPKTGEMIQCWIIRADLHPAVAATNGEDFSICGNCALRTKINDEGKQERVCYVNPFQAPRAVYTAFNEGKYPYLGSLKDIATMHAGHSVRLGAYGDPAALPFEIVAAMVRRASNWTGYTHQWQTADRRLRRYLMASVETEEQAKDATRLGWRTFRVRGPDEPIVAGEITCPAAPEAGHRTQCADCTLCNGRRSYERAGRRLDDPRRNIVILAHGKGMALFGKKVLPVYDKPL